MRKIWGFLPQIQAPCGQGMPALLHWPDGLQPGLESTNRYIIYSYQRLSDLGCNLFYRQNRLNALSPDLAQAFRGRHQRCLEANYSREKACSPLMTGAGSS